MVSALALTLALAQQSIPVAGRIVVGNPAAVELTNNASQAVTAWSFAVVSPNAQGGMHREEHTADVYLSGGTRDLCGAASVPRGAHRARLSVGGVTRGPPRPTGHRVGEARGPPVRGRSGVTSLR